VLQILIVFSWFFVLVEYIYDCALGDVNIYDCALGDVSVVASFIAINEQLQ